MVKRGGQRDHVAEDHLRALAYKLYRELDEEGVWHIFTLEQEPVWSDIVSEQINNELSSLAFPSCTLIKAVKGRNAEMLVEDRGPFIRCKRFRYMADNVAMHRVDNVILSLRILKSLRQDVDIDKRLPFVGQTSGCNVAGVIEYSVHLECFRLIF